MPFCFIASIAFFETSLWNAGSSLSADWMIVTFGGVRSAFLYSAWPCSSLSARWSLWSLWEAQPRFHR